MKHRSTFSKTYTFWIGSLFAMGALFSCKKSNNDTSKPAPPNNIRVVTTAKYGKILTDSAGVTLYFFSNDPNGTSTCTGGCATSWPAYYKANPTLDTGLNSTDLSSFTRSDGPQQLSYKGWPLYYYAPDSSVAGNIKGEGVGGVWFVAKPDYSVMLAKTQLVGNDGISYDSTYKAATGKTLYLTDDYGRTLYTFSPDKFKKNNFTKSDFTNDPTWPIYQVSAQSVPSIIDHSLFDTIHVFGRVQLTFKGWPMYYFGTDNKQRGSTKGVSVPTPGFWPVIDQFKATAPL